ncbi:unnamed protein product [Sphacelaria rigidula]
MLLTVLTSRTQSMACEMPLIPITSRRHIQASEFIVLNTHNSPCLNVPLTPICRKAAAKIVLEDQEAGSRPPTQMATTVVTVNNLEKFMGEPVVASDRRYEWNTRIGVVNGLACTAEGGRLIIVESIAIPSPSSDPATTADDAGGANRAAGGVGRGKADLIVTGQLGPVMMESAQLAFSVAQNILPSLMSDRAEFFNQVKEVHIHVPEGETPKNGPSAGVTMVTSLLSLATNTPVRTDLAMTGELSLTGMVLPVGDIKEKIIAAKEWGKRCLVLPQENKEHFDKLPNDLKNGFEVHFASTYQDIYRVALDHHEE